MRRIRQLKRNGESNKRARAELFESRMFLNYVLVRNRGNSLSILLLYPSLSFSFSHSLSLSLSLSLSPSSFVCMTDFLRSTIRLISATLRCLLTVG